MLEILVWLVFSGFAFIGVAAVVRSIEDRILSSRTKRNITCVYPIKGHADDAEEIIQAYHNRVHWDHPSCGSLLIVLDMGLDEDTLALCRKLCEQYGEMMLCSPEELDAVLQSKVNVLAEEK